MNWKAAWRALLGQPAETVTVYMPSPIDLRTLYRKEYGNKFHTTPAAAFADGFCGRAVNDYTAFRAGGRWYGFRGHFELMPIADVSPEDA